MSGTKSFPADNVKLHIASAADAPTGTMTVLMRTNRYYTDGSLLQTGEEYTVTKEWGQDALSRNWCEDVADVFPETETPSGLTAAQVAATRALVSGAGTTLAMLRKPTSSVRLIGLSTASAASAGATRCLKVEADAPFNRVRLRLKNTAATTVTGVKAAVAATETASASTTELVYQPHVGGTQYNAARASEGAPGWAVSTFVDAGTTTIPARTSAYQAGELVSDWIDVRSVARSDGGTLPLLLIRVFATDALSSAGNFTTTWARESGERWWRMYRAGTIVGADGVGDLTLNGGSESSAGLLIEVEYGYAVPALTVAGNGDSNFENSEQVASRYGTWLWRGCALASTPARPITYMNLGANGQTSATFSPAGLADLAAGKVNVLVHQLYSTNDGDPTQALVNVALARLSKTLAAASAVGARLLVLTALPKSFTATPDAFRVTLNNEVRAWAASGAFDLLDGDLLLSDGASPAALQVALRADVTHPNDAGHEILGQALAAYLSGS